MNRMRKTFTLSKMGLFFDNMRGQTPIILLLLLDITVKFSPVLNNHILFLIDISDLFLLHER